MPTGLDHGVVKITIEQDDIALLAAECTAYPGSPAAPATDAQIEAKIEDCLSRFNERSGSSLTPHGFRASLQVELGLA
jgi:hypothetical protein